MTVPVKGSDQVVEPEVLPSLEEAERTSGGGTGGAQGPFGPGGPFAGRRPQGTVKPLGCSLGPGCGCIGLPFAVLAGVAISSLVALLWVLSLGRVPASLIRLAKQARRGFTRS